MPCCTARRDPDNRMALLEGPVDIFHSDEQRRGNTNEINGLQSHLEGAWMNKINGRYYLIYAVPGTA